MFGSRTLSAGFSMAGSTSFGWMTPFDRFSFSLKFGAGTVELEGVVGVGLLASANADPTRRLIIPATNTQIRKPMIVTASQTRLCADRSPAKTYICPMGNRQEADQRPATNWILCFSALYAVAPFPERGRFQMSETKVPRPRLNVIGRAARTKRIFARMREGWAIRDRPRRGSQPRARPPDRRRGSRRARDRPRPAPRAPAARTPDARAPAAREGSSAARSRPSHP